MGLLGWVWLGSPFVVIALIAHDHSMQAWIASHYDACRVTGWVGAVMMFLGVALAPAVLGILMFVVGTPLVGLVVWLRDDRDDRGEGDSDEPPIDWDEFERSFWAHVRRGRLPRLPRAPSGV